MTQTTRRIISLSFLVAAFALIGFGPQWPGRATSLMCGESPATIAEKALFPDMDACAVAMSGTRCYCSVKERPFAPAYYLVLVPSAFVAATWMFTAATARGMAAVVFVLATTLLLPGLLVSRMYGAGIRIPKLLAIMAVGWTQVVFFGPTMFWAEPRNGLVLPHRWASLVTLAFWLVAAFGFGFFARRVRSPAVLVVSAVGFVAGIALAVRVTAPLLNWQMLMEFP